MGAGDLMSMGTCRPSAPPLGAIPPTPPAWCAYLGSARSTAVSGPDSWVDTFASGGQMTVFPPGYRVFEAARPSLVYRTKTFAHNDHWMVDVAGHGDPPAQYEGDPRDLAVGAHYGGALVRPDRTFHFVDGRLSVEFDASAGMLALNDGWPEVIVTTAPGPTAMETDPLHAIGVFGGAPSVGCRFYNDRTVACSAYEGTAPSARAFEVSAIADAGARVEGGSPASPERAAAWRTCPAGMPDSGCRDRFTVELSESAITVRVNGTTYFTVADLPPGQRLPAGLLGAEVYVYFASWAYIAEDSTLRFHWGRIAVQP